MENHPLILGITATRAEETFRPVTPDEALLARLLDAKSKRQVTPLGHFYRNPEAFVLRHGNFHQVCEGRVLAPRACFANAGMIAGLYRRWTYVEGYALPPVGQVPNTELTYALSGMYEAVPHAWVLNPAGRAIELTWAAAGRTYVGVAFSAARAFDCHIEGDATVLDDHKRGWPLLREPWQGEDFDTPLSDAADDVHAFYRLNAPAALGQLGFPPLRPKPSDRIKAQRGKALIESWRPT